MIEEWCFRSVSEKYSDQSKEFGMQSRNVAIKTIMKTLE